MLPLFSEVTRVSLKSLSPFLPLIRANIASTTTLTMLRLAKIMVTMYTVLSAAFSFPISSTADTSLR